MFNVGEELKVISVDLPTTGIHAILLEETQKDDGTILLVLRAGGKRKDPAGCVRPICEEK